MSKIRRSNFDESSKRDKNENQNVKRNKVNCQLHLFFLYKQKSIL